MKLHEPLVARILSRLAPGVLSLALATAAAAEGASDAFVRDHEHGETALRFQREHFHYALIFDARPRVNVGRDVVTAGGRRIGLEWSGRSIWIDGAKFELPFGAVFLLDTRDSTRARQLEFNAMRGRLLLDQAAAAPAVAQWLGSHGDVRDTVMRGAVQAATYPRHTLELTEWSYHGVRAVTCVVSGDPLFVLFSPTPLHGGSSTQTFFGNLAAVEVQVGEADGRRTWHATSTNATFAGHTYEFSKGRVFLIPASGGDVTQAPSALDLGPESASRIADEIERIPEVRAFLRLESRP
jgi:hypothetical protein